MNPTGPETMSAIHTDPVALIEHAQRMEGLTPEQTAALATLLQNVQSNPNYSPTSAELSLLYSLKIDHEEVNAAFSLHSITPALHPDNPDYMA